MLFLCAILYLHNNMAYNKFFSPYNADKSNFKNPEKQTRYCVTEILFMMKFN